MSLLEKRFFVLVKTGCSESCFSGQDSSGSYLVSLHARPFDGEANKELLRFLRKELGKPVRIVSGFRSKKKLIEFIL